jgi:hypothetical protein
MALAMRRARKSGNFVFYTMDAFRIAQIAAIAAADLPEANANQRVAELQAMIDALKLEQERVMSKS